MRAQAAEYSGLDYRSRSANPVLISLLLIGGFLPITKPGRARSGNSSILLIFMNCLGSARRYGCRNGFILSQNWFVGNRVDLDDASRIGQKQKDNAP
jgi:hypothetical protein